MQGRIHRLIRGKGFGFIQTDDRQFFFHHSEVRETEFRRLSLGDLVEFKGIEEDEDGKNPRATEIQVLEKAEKIEKPPAATQKAPRKPRQGRGAAAPRAKSAKSAKSGGGGQKRRGKGERPARPPAAQKPSEDNFGEGLLWNEEEEFTEELPGGPKPVEDRQSETSASG